MTAILAIDPGNVISAFVVLDGDRILEHGKVSNIDMLRRLRRTENAGPLAIEMIASYGRPVGSSIFQTCVWIGRLIEAYPAPSTFVYRQEVKRHLCGGRMKSSDSDVRAALIAKWGGNGGKRQRPPEALRGIKADEWAALAVAVTWRDKYGSGFDVIEAAP